jgi:hypothetical protein
VLDRLIVKPRTSSLSGKPKASATMLDPIPELGLTVRERPSLYACRRGGCHAVSHSGSGERPGRTDANRLIVRDRLRLSNVLSYSDGELGRLGQPLPG